MKIVNKKGEKYSLCKHPTQNVLKRKFDKFHQGMSRRHVFRILLQNSEFQFFAIYNFWLYVSIFTLICENTLLLSCMDEEEKCLSKDK